MSFIERMLEKLAVFHKNNAVTILVIALMITTFSIVGMSKVSMQTDFSKEMPQDLPIMILNNKITDKFSGQDTVFLILTLDETLDSKDSPKDIRDPLTMQYITLLEQTLVKETSVERIVSAATYLEPYQMYSSEILIQSIENSPARAFISDDYRTTFMLINSDIGTGEDKIIAISKLIDDKVDALSTPPGVKLTITGNPSLRITILKLLQQDAFFTVSLASFIILLLLFVMKRSFTKGFLVFIPLMFGLIWTMGTMGWIGIKLSVATVGVGAMILGLGVEYGVFMQTRYQEERDKGKSQLTSLKVAVPGVGSAILGSGLTTMAGFLALSFSLMPMLQKLGQTLALGIFFCVAVTILVMPSIIILEERFRHWYAHRNHKNSSKIIAGGLK